MTTKSYWECHITMSGAPETVRKKVEAIGWIFSKIDGDPVTGPGVKCYATKHLNIDAWPLTEAIIQLNEAAIRLEIAGVVVTRRKLEQVVYDRRGSAIAPSRDDANTGQQVDDGKKDDSHGQEGNPAGNADGGQDGEHQGQDGKDHDQHGDAPAKV